MSDLQSITLSNDPLIFEGITQTKSETLPNGIVVTAIVENSKIVGYSARDANGNPLEVKLLTLSSGDSTGIEAKHCYTCFCDQVHCECNPAACPDPP